MRLLPPKHTRGVRCEAIFLAVWYNKKINNWSLSLVPGTKPGTLAIFCISMLMRQSLVDPQVASGWNLVPPKNQPHDYRIRAFSPSAQLLGIRKGLKFKFSH